LPAFAVIAPAKHVLRQSVLLIQRVRFERRWWNTTCMMNALCQIA
jgi:hypothetical protein